jgi:hypothetical protein
MVPALFPSALKGAALMYLSRMLGRVTPAGEICGARQFILGGSKKPDETYGTVGKKPWKKDSYRLRRVLPRNCFNQPMYRVKG